MTTLVALLGALLVKPALVLAAATAITACLRRHTAAARHAVWAGAIIATLALPVLRTALPPLRIPGLLTAIARSLPGGPWFRTASPSVADTGTHLGASGALPDNGVLDRMGLGGAAPQRRHPQAILVIWVLGALLLGARRAIAEVQAHRIVRRGRPASNPKLVRLFTDIARSSGIPPRVELRLSDKTASPVVAGVLRPVVLLPVAADTWRNADLAAVLVHELGHVARRDCLVNLMGDAATVIFWCNPVVRLAVGRMRAESERACDDRVLQGGAEPEGYAHLLLTVARTARTVGLSGAATAMARPRELESRLLAVLDARMRRTPLPRWMPVTLAGLAVVCALPTAALTLRAAPVTAASPLGPEPDRLSDSLAGPASERLPHAPEAAFLAPAVTAALAGPDSALTLRLVAALGHEPDHDGDLVRERAAWALSQARDGRLVEPLVEALDARDWHVQAYAAWALATAHDPRAVPRLIPLLDHPVWRLRAMAAYALRESRDRRAVDPMNTALTDPAWQVRVEAVEYFAALGGPALPGRLRPRLDDRHAAVRFAAEQTLTSR